MWKPLLFNCLLLTITLNPFSQALGDSVMIDGVEHVRNSSTPRDGVQDLQLKELWRAGGEDDDTFFGLVPRVAADPQGNVYILDSQTCHVYVYSPEGEMLRTLFREGEGPGEVLRARDLVLMGDGRVGVIQEFPGAVSFVHFDGTPAGRISLNEVEGGVMSLTSCGASGNVLLLSGSHNKEGSKPEIRLRWNVLERFDADGKLMARYASNHAEYDFADFHFKELDHLPVFWFTFDATEDGRVFTSSNHHEYEVSVYAPDGSLERVIEREYESFDRSKAEYRRLELMILSAFNGAPFQPKLEIEKQEAALAYFHRAIQLHTDGKLWVLSGRGLRPDKTRSHGHL